MAKSKRQKLLEVLKARLQEIRTAKGYNTDAGARVRHGRLSVTEDDLLPRVAATVGEPEVHGQGDRIRLRLPVEVYGLAAADVDEFAIEPLLADIKKAIFRADDKTLGGLAIELEYIGEATFDREDGGSMVGCRVNGAVSYMETYGDPTGPVA